MPVKPSELVDCVRCGGSGLDPARPRAWLKLKPAAWLCVVCRGEGSVWIVGRQLVWGLPTSEVRPRKQRAARGPRAARAPHEGPHAWEQLSLDDYRGKGLLLRSELDAAVGRMMAGKVKLPGRPLRKGKR